jgi:hypothetical protein
VERAPDLPARAERIAPMNDTRACEPKKSESAAQILHGVGRFCRLPLVVRAQCLNLLQAASIDNGSAVHRMLSLRQK